MMTDPISDMLTRIRNGALARKSEVRIPFSKLKFSLAKLLEREEFIRSAREESEAGRPTLAIDLVYDGTGKPAIREIQRVSRPGRRVYAKAGALPKVLNDYGIAVISTPQGLMTNKEAKKRGLGGEIICEVY
jgi:small subunit ribosomal protein S8